MSEPRFKCHQTSESVHVVVDGGQVAVVSISRAVPGGGPTARRLMRLCNAVLNGDLLEAQAELDQFANPTRPDVTYPTRTTMYAIKYAYTYGSLYASAFDGDTAEEDAIRSADAASDEGMESLLCIEVVTDDGITVLSDNDVWERARALRPEPDPASEQPSEWWRVEIKSPEGGWAILDNFSNEDWANTAAAKAAEHLGADRVKTLHRTKR